MIRRGPVREADHGADHEADHGADHEADHGADHEADHGADHAARGRSVTVDRECEQRLVRVQGKGVVLRS